ncbi:MAG: hypothetical protein JNG84_13265 [Archangium sp.]|nr:hypothetical protein [Archangium sp.]
MKSLVQIQSPSDSEMERARERLLATGWFNRVDVSASALLPGDARHVVIQVDVSSPEALCRAAGETWAPKPAPKAARPDDEGCPHGKNCVQLEPIIADLIRFFSETR